MVFSNSDHSYSWWIWTFAKCLFPPVGLSMTISMLLLNATATCGSERYETSFLMPSSTHLVAWSKPSQSNVSTVGTSMLVSSAKFLKHESTVHLPLRCYESWVPGGQKAMVSSGNGKPTLSQCGRTSSWKVVEMCMSHVRLWGKKTRYLNFTGMNDHYFYHHPKELFGWQSPEVILGYKFPPCTPTISSIWMREGGFHLPFSAQCFLLA